MLSPPIMANFAFVPCLWTLEWSQLMPSITKNKFWNFIAGFFCHLLLVFWFFVFWVLWSHVDLGDMFLMRKLEFLLELRLISFLIFIYLILCACMCTCMHTMCTQDTWESEDGIKIPLNRSYPGWLQAAMWMSETEPGSSVDPLNYLPLQPFLFLLCFSYLRKCWAEVICRGQMEKELR